MTLPVLNPIAAGVSEATRPRLRPYQEASKNYVNQFWSISPQGNALVVLPTGAGKTVFFSDVIRDEPGATCAVAHRQELVCQISVALARNGVRHRIIARSPTIKSIVRQHMEEVGKSFYDPSSRHAVAGVDTLVRRGEKLVEWLPTVKLWVMDEAHHVLTANKWGKAVTMFPNARGLGVTATPSRADGNGLGRHADGVFDIMYVGTSMRELINMGFLTDYKLYAPVSTFDRGQLATQVSDSTGDFKAGAVSKAVNESSLIMHTEKQIVGDVVNTYKKLLNGALTVVFAPDVSTATELEQQYNAAGISAKCVHGAMDGGDAARIAAIRDFKNRKYLVLTSVAIFDEGFDCPAIEAVQDVAATESFGRFVQRAGRMLRLKDGKLFGKYVDHVGNIQRHATVVQYPTGAKIELCHREWTLDRREKRSSKSEVSSVRVCLACTSVYERFRDACPDCGEPVPAPAERGAPEFVDGDLYELDAATLANMRGDIIGATETPEAMRDRLTAQRVPMPGVMANVKRQVERIESLAYLDDAMIRLGTIWRHRDGLSNSEIYRKFYLWSGGIDWMTAQTLKRDEADKLAQRIDELVKGV